MGCFSDARTNLAEFRTLVQTLKPVEVVTLYAENSKEYVKLLRSLTQKPIISYMTADKLPGVPETDQLAKHYAENNSSNESLYPDGLEKMMPKLLSENQISILAIGLGIRYLEDMMMADVTVPFASFRPYHGDSENAFLNIQTNMILDFATQESLEIFSNTPEDEQEKDSMKYKCLADLLDHTATPFGRRLLRKWLSSPLVEVEKIQER